MEKQIKNGNDFTPVIRRSFFGAKYLYLDDNTRVRYGFVLAHVGTAYTLQRKKGRFWKEVAWAYPSAYVNLGIDSLIEYLKWYEEYEKRLKKRLKTKCLF